MFGEARRADQREHLRRARRRPRGPSTSSSCVSVPASKNFSISASSASATISISASRALFAASAMSAGTAPSLTLPEPSAAYVNAFIDTRSTTPLKSRLFADRQLNRHDRAAERQAERLQRALERRALAIEAVDARSGGAARSSSQAAHAFSVCTSTPATRVDDDQRAVGDVAWRRARRKRSCRIPACRSG